MDHILSLSYGKDSMACLGAVGELRYPLNRIIHSEVWATKTILADLPPMVEFKQIANEIIKNRYGIEVESIRASQTAEQMMLKKRVRGKRVGQAMGWPMTKGAKFGCELQKKLKVSPIKKLQKESIIYLGIAKGEVSRYGNLTKTVRSPLVEADWTEYDCFQWCKKNGLLAPIYTDSARAGCWFCPNQTVDQLRSLRTKYPEYWALMLKWDAASPFCFTSNKWKLIDYEKRFQMEDEKLIFSDDRSFRWSMLEEELNYRLF